MGEQNVVVDAGVVAFHVATKDELVFAQVFNDLPNCRFRPAISGQVKAS